MQNALNFRQGGGCIKDKLAAGGQKPSYGYLKSPPGSGHPWLQINAGCQPGRHPPPFGANRGKLEMLKSGCVL